MMQHTWKIILQLHVYKKYCLQKIRLHSKYYCTKNVVVYKTQCGSNTYIENNVAAKCFKKCCRNIFTEKVLQPYDNRN